MAKKLHQAKKVQLQLQLLGNSLCLRTLGIIKTGEHL